MGLWNHNWAFFELFWLLVTLAATKFCLHFSQFFWEKTQISSSVSKTKKNDSWLTNQIYEKFLFTFFLNFCWDSSSHLSLGLHCLEKILSLSFSWKQLWHWIKKILAIRQKKWNRSLIILVDLMNWIVSDKLFLDIQLIHSFMPNLHQKSWMV